MSKIPFTVYDFFAYLSSGALVVGSLDYTIGYQWLAQPKLPIPIALLLILASYLTGHLVAHSSKFLLEDLFVSKCLGPSSVILMQPRAKTTRAIFFPGYHKPLPIEVQKRVLEKATRRGVTSVGESLFLHAYGVLTQDKESQARLDEFRNLYGFCRNTALALVLATLVLGVGRVVDNQPSSLLAVAMPAAMSVGMVYRYLKFYRQFSFQLFIKYAELPPAEAKVNS